MVNISSGDFNYNIPLLDVGGYPINIAYHSGIGMDDEASTVGLGWNINVGSLNRNVRGLPDDFNGDEVRKKVNILPNETIGINGRLSTELFGFEIMKKSGPLGAFGFNLGVFHNNYKGLGIEFGASPVLTLAKWASSDGTSGLGPLPKGSSTVDTSGTSAIGLNLGFNFNSQAGTDFDIRFQKYTSSFKSFKSILQVSKVYFKIQKNTSS